MHVVWQPANRPVARDRAGAPPVLLYLSEPFRAAHRLAVLTWCAPWLATAPTGDGHPVLVLPGLLASDSSTAILRAYLRRLRYEVHGWDLGRNLGPTSEALDGMADTLRELAAGSGRAVSLVGWSLGGIYARELARDNPHLVRRVITLGSPFAMTDSKQSRADAAYRRRAHLHAPGRVPGRADTARPIPVPSTAIYSERDGIVAWPACVEPPSARHDNVAVRCGHLGFGIDPATLWVVADRLAQPAGTQNRFRPPARLRRLFPNAR